MYRCMSTTSSPVLAVLKELWEAVDEAHDYHAVVWRALIARFGAVAAWPEEMLEKAVKSLNLVIGGLFRRFYLRVAGTFPWMLYTIIDKTEPLDERKRFAEQVFGNGYRPCCADDFFTKPLRALIPSVDSLFLEPIQVFLHQIFWTAIASSTHVEDIFAHMRRVCQQAWKPLHASTLFSTHVLTECKRIHRTYVESEPDLLEARQRLLQPLEGRTRPIWQLSRSRRNIGKISAWGLYISDTYHVVAASMPRPVFEPKKFYRKRVMTSLGQHWSSDMSLHDRLLWAGKAAQARTEAKLRGDPLKDFVACAGEVQPILREGYPFGLCDFEYPIAEAVLQEACDTWDGVGSFTKNKSDCWRKDHGFVLVEDKQLPDVLGIHIPCGDICQQCLGKFDAETLAEKDLVLDVLKKLVAPNGRVTRGMGVMLQCLIHDNEDVLIIDCSHLKQPRYIGEFFVSNKLMNVLNLEQMCVSPCSTHVFVGVVCWVLSCSQKPMLHHFCLPQTEAPNGYRLI